MVKGRKAKIGQSYVYRGIKIDYDGEFWHFGADLQKTLAACKTVIDANLVKEAVPDVDRIAQ